VKCRAPVFNGDEASGWLVSLAGSAAALFAPFFDYFPCS
jgi:hypothetical protein